MKLEENHWVDGQRYKYTDLHIGDIKLFREGKLLLTGHELDIELNYHNRETRLKFSSIILPKKDVFISWVDDEPFKLMLQLKVPTAEVAPISHQTFFMWEDVTLEVDNCQIHAFDMAEQNKYMIALKDLLVIGISKVDFLGRG